MIVQNHFRFFQSCYEALKIIKIILKIFSGPKHFSAKKKQNTLSCLCEVIKIYTHCKNLSSFQTTKFFTIDFLVKLGNVRGKSIFLVSGSSVNFKVRKYWHITCFASLSQYYKAVYLKKN